MRAALVPWLLFDHPLFRGRGEFLLRWLGVPPTRVGFYALLARLYPAESDAAFLETFEADVLEEPCAHDREHLERAILASGSRDCRPEEPYWSSWRALAGGAPESAPTPENILVARATGAEVRALVERLAPRLRGLVIEHFGLDGGEGRTFDDLGEAQQVSRERVRQIVAKGLRILRYHLLVLEKRRGC